MTLTVASKSAASDETVSLKKEHCWKDGTLLVCDAEGAREIDEALIEGELCLTELESSHKAFRKKLWTERVFWGGGFLLLLLIL